MFNLQELQTVMHYNLPIKIFVIDNDGYLTQKLMQIKNFKRYVGAHPKSGVSCPNFVKIGKAFNFETSFINSDALQTKLLNKILALAVLPSTTIRVPGNKKCSKVKISADIGNRSGWFVEIPLTSPIGENWSGASKYIKSGQIFGKSSYRVQIRSLKVVTLQGQWWKVTFFVEG